MYILHVHVHTCIYSTSRFLHALQYETYILSEQYFRQLTQQSGLESKIILAIKVLNYAG